MRAREGAVSLERGKAFRLGGQRGHPQNGAGLLAVKASSPTIPWPIARLEAGSYRKIETRFSILSSLSSKGYGPRAWGQANGEEVPSLPAVITTKSRAPPRARCRCVASGGEGSSSESDRLDKGGPGSKCQ